MLFIFPEIPRLMHPCYLGRMGAPEYSRYIPIHTFIEWDLWWPKFQLGKFGAMVIVHDYIDFGYLKSKLDLP